MSSKKIHDSEKELEEIWHQVPVNYYQKGIKENILQRMWHTQKLKIVLDFIGSANREPKNILDVGCASGWFLSKIKEKYPKSKCSGVDVYKKSIEYGKKLYTSLDLQYADAHRLPFPDKSYDVIICTEVLEHVVEPKKVLEEIRRVLASDGIAIIEMDTGNFLFRLIWHWWTHLRQGVWRDSHIHIFNIEKLEDLIQKSGFLIKKKKLFNATMAVAFLLKKGKNYESKN